MAYHLHGDFPGESHVHRNLLLDACIALRNTCTNQCKSPKKEALSVVNRNMVACLQFLSGFLFHISSKDFQMLLEGSKNILLLVCNSSILKHNRGLIYRLLVFSVHNSFCCVNITAILSLSLFDFAQNVCFQTPCDLHELNYDSLCAWYLGVVLSTDSSMRKKRELSH